MAKGVNKVILLGHLGSDPEMRYAASGMAIANLNLATNQATRNKQTNEWEETVEWHRVVLFDKLAQIAGEYLRKGTQVYIEGRLQTRKWQDQHGQDRWTTEVVASDMQMVGGRTDNTTASYANPPSQSYVAQPPPTTPNKGGYSSPPSPPDVAYPQSPSKNFDDDIPF